MYIKNVKIHKVRNLSNISIPISTNDEMRHLIITGANGSGKTSLLEAIREYCHSAVEASNLDIDSSKTKFYDIELDFACGLDDIRASFENGDFLLAYFGARHEFFASQPDSIKITQLNKQYEMGNSARIVFLEYLLDLKAKEAFSINNGKKEKAEQIKRWFERFRDILRDIYDDKELSLEFEEDSYRFLIQTKGHDPFDLNSASDGFSSIIDIIAEITLRMTGTKGLSFSFDKAGIVLIDELETHLHLELQRKIFGYLTKLFPRLQFIVTTHSPFVLAGAENAVIYDLENKILVNGGLSNVPYSGIVEGYFKADELSDTLRSKFERYSVLAKKKNISDAEIEEISDLEFYLDEIPDYLALGLTTEYSRLKREFYERGE